MSNPLGETLKRKIVAIYGESIKGGSEPVYAANVAKIARIAVKHYDTYKGKPENIVINLYKKIDPYLHVAHMTGRHHKGVLLLNTISNLEDKYAASLAVVRSLR